MTSEDQDRTNASRTVRVALLESQLSLGLDMGVSRMMNLLNRSFILRGISGISDIDFNSTDVFIIPRIEGPLSITEIEILHDLVAHGVGVLICVGSECPRKVRENVNFFLEEYGLSVGFYMYVWSIFIGSIRYGD